MKNLLPSAPQFRSHDVPPVRHQRVDGAARLGFSRSGLSDLYQRAPCRFLFPDGEADDFPLAVLLTTSGGLTGGDRIATDIRLGTGARGTVMTQAAEKLYRVLPEEADIRIDTRINVADNATAEWLSQEAIIFDRSRLRRSIEIDLAENSRLLCVEMAVLGRRAMGERFASGLFHDAWRIRRNGRIIWADAIHMEGNCGEIATLPYGLGVCTALATLVYAGADAASHLELARTLAPPPLGGATCFDGLLILRMTSEDGMSLRTAVTRAAGALRHAAWGAPTRLPSTWYS